MSEAHCLRHASELMQAIGLKQAGWRHQSGQIGRENSERLEVNLVAHTKPDPGDQERKGTEEGIGNGLQGDCYELANWGIDTSDFIAAELEVAFCVLVRK
jgi:hypothetical protein